MLPEIFRIGPVTIHSYGLSIALGTFLAVFLMTQKARRFSFPPPDKIIDLVFVIVFSGFVGARLFYVVQEWEWYRNHFWEIFQIWKGGLVYFGGVVVSFLSFFAYLYVTHLPILKTTDFAIQYVPLVHAFGRLGCFLNGCCYGKPSDLPWAVRFPFPAHSVHPTQIYELIFNLVLFAIMVSYYPRRRFAGEMIIFYLITYSLGRFFIEFFREGQPVVAFGYSLHQILSLVFIVIAILAYGFHCLRAR